MSSGRIPWAIWEPITKRSRVSNHPVRMTVHITAVRANDIYGPNKGPGNTYAHFHNSRNGDLRQHQELNKMAEADLDGNGETVTVENEGREGDSLTDAQIENLARLFAHCVTEFGVPNRIATVDDTRGLAWHRLGVEGNFGTYKASDMTTWSRAQTGKRWTKARGKTCPTDRVIRQIPEIYARAQAYINRGTATAPTPQEDDMANVTDAQLALLVDGAEKARHVYEAVFNGSKANGRTYEALVEAVRLLPGRNWSATVGRDEHRKTLAAVLVTASQATAEVAALREALTQLGAGGSVDYDRIAQIVRENTPDAIDVTVTVDDNTKES